MSNSLVEVQELKKYYADQNTLIDRILRRESTNVHAVDGVSFEIRQGETLGLVGESGCGKSTTAETVLGLREATEGSVLFEGENIFDQSDLTDFRRQTGIVFQDPFSSLDPRMTVREIIQEPMVIHDTGTKTERHDRVEELLEQVGLSLDHVDRYPHEFSGGQRQRIGIARALSLKPKFIVLDEPVSALDVSVQAQILNLLADLQEKLDLTYLLIAHDLSVVKHISDTVAVMYLGQIVEQGPAEELFINPEHPYTRALLDSVPRARTAEQHRQINPIKGDVPSPRNPPSGCSFRTRCPEIIPPNGLDVQQEIFKEIMTLRDRIRSSKLKASELIEEENSNNGDADVDAVIKTLFSEPPGEETRAIVHDALEKYLSGEENAAATKLEETFTSVCERDDPELQQLDESDQIVACHLHN